MEQIQADGTVRTVIHFSFKERGLGARERIACMLGKNEVLHETINHPNFQRSNDPRAVNCTFCKKSDAYNNAMGELGLHGIR